MRRHQGADLIWQHAYLERGLQWARWHRHRIRGNVGIPSEARFAGCEQPAEARQRMHYPRDALLAGRRERPQQARGAMLSLEHQVCHEGPPHIVLPAHQCVQIAWQWGGALCSRRGPLPSAIIVH